MIELLDDRQTSRFTTMNLSPTANLSATATSTRQEPTASERVAEELVKLFKLLSDETRLRILLALTEVDELHVRALCDFLRQSQPAVSHHLALLRVAGLIDRRREGKHNYYRLVSGKFEHLLDLVFDISDKSDRRLRFKNYVLSYTPA